MRAFKSSTGLPEHLAGALCYLVPFVGGIVFLGLEQHSRFVLFHALQSLIAFGLLMVLHVLAGLVPLLGPLLAALCFLTGFAVWLLMIFQALRGNWYRLPWAGALAERQLRHL